MRNSLMPANFKTMLQNGVANQDVISCWLATINCEEYLKNFVDSGYDMPTIARMTPQDLAAIGCKSPAMRKRLILEIKKLNVDDDIPDSRANNFEQWLELLKLSEYHKRLCEEGYDTIDKVCKLTWEDLEDIGIHKLGHQKRILLGIEKIQKFDKQQEERQNDNAIYDVHPNHRISLNQNYSDSRLNTLSRSTVRSGFFQTRSGANLDHRGLPVATVMPALKHVNNTLSTNLDVVNQQIYTTNGIPKINSQNTNGFSNNRLSTSDQSNQFSSESQMSNNELIMSDLSTSTMKRNLPPLPPIRSNSLKINDNSIYGSTYGTVHMGHYASMSTSSTSFLRTPKLGTLTATTNKMLTLGGHIQPVNGQPTTLRSIMPIREAPQPPIQMHPQVIPGNIDEESVRMFDSMNNNNVGSSTFINAPSIGHQLASADEFPPPPPPQ